MAKVVHLRAPVPADTGEGLHEAPARKRRGEDLHDRGVAIALIAAHLITGSSTQRCQSSRAVHQRLQDLLRVRHLCPVPRDHHPGRGRLAHPGVILDFAALDNGRRAVQTERKLLVRRETEG